MSLFTVYKTLSKKVKCKKLMAMKATINERENMSAGSMSENQVA